MLRLVCLPSSSIYYDDQAIEQKDQVIEQQKNALHESVRMLAQSGVPEEQMDFV